MGYSGPEQKRAGLALFTSASLLLLSGVMLTRFGFLETFGLGNSPKIDSLVVYWPGGKRQEVIVSAVDRSIVVEQVP